MLRRSFQRMGALVFISLIILSKIRLVKVSSLISSPVGNSNVAEMAPNSLSRMFCIHSAANASIIGLAPFAHLFFEVADLRGFHHHHKILGSSSLFIKKD